MAGQVAHKKDGWREHIVLYAALAANIGIAVAKFIAAALSGSSSMLTEGFHCLPRISGSPSRNSSRRRFQVRPRC
ncbi:cation transporter [Stakelama pacifica]|uniref:cation transporter n=1 Tax=Stakelama pacifica TaxID=517720 RepID=UPI0010614E1F